MTYGIDTGFLVAAEVIEHPRHHSARDELAEFVAAGDPFILAPQVLIEFIHIVTDPRRFKSPLTINLARDIAEQWWSAREVLRVVTDAGAVAQFFQWHRIHQLGRKRILDTLLAATYRNAGVMTLLTTNAADFEILQALQCITP